jgi:hypothetical protein
VAWITPLRAASAGFNYDLSPNPVATNGRGALDDASSAAFRAADNVSDFSVGLKHQPWASGGWNKFAEGVDQSAVIREALTSDAATFRPNYVGGVLSEDSSGLSRISVK